MRPSLHPRSLCCRAVLLLALLVGLTACGAGGAFALYDNETTPIHPFRELLLRPFVHVATNECYTFRSIPWGGGFDFEMTLGETPSCAPTEIVVPRQAGGLLLDYRVTEGAAELAYERDAQKLVVVPRCAGCTLRIKARRP